VKTSVLVVGGAGYIGSHMVRALLDAGHAVTVFDNLSHGHRDAAIVDDFVEGDLLDPSDIARAFRGRGFDVVMHFAALWDVGESVQQPQRYWRNNVVGSLNLLDAMLDAGVRRVVFSSTCATYGVPLAVPITEAHPQSPANPYGWTKLAIERALADYSRASGMRSVSLRYFNAAGCHPDGTLGERHDPETHLIPSVLKEARRVIDGGDPDDTQLVVNGEDYDTPDGTCIRDYVHVCDLASAHLAAGERLVGGLVAGAEAYNLGTDRGFSVKEVIDACRRVAGTPIRYRGGPRRAGDPPRLVSSSALARDTLGWRPAYAELDAIVATAWSWFGRNQLASRP
jgi:UDP-glucose-4-epimerase GalE